MGILSGALAGGEGKNRVRLGPMINVCATNTITRVMLGKRVVGHDRDEKAEEFKAMVMELMVLAGVFNVGDYFPILESLDLQGVAAKMKNLHKRFDAFLTAILLDHKIGEVDGHVDLLSTLISLKDCSDGDGERLTDTEIKALLLVCLSHKLIFLSSRL